MDVKLIGSVKDKDDPKSHRIPIFLIQISPSVFVWYFLDIDHVEHKDVILQVPDTHNQYISQLTWPSKEQNKYGKIGR